MENPNLAIFVTSAFLHDQKISKIPLNLTTFRQKPSYYVAWILDTCVMCSVCEITLSLQFFALGKKYCYGSTQGEYCHCDYCKCKHGYGSTGYGHCH